MVKISWPLCSWWPVWENAEVLGLRCCPELGECWQRHGHKQCAESNAHATLGSRDALKFNRLPGEP